jgi:hypothetical protein
VLYIMTQAIHRLPTESFAASHSVLLPQPIRLFGQLPTVESSATGEDCWSTLAAQLCRSFCCVCFAPVRALRGSFCGLSDKPTSLRRYGNLCMRHTLAPMSRT